MKNIMLKVCGMRESKNINGLVSLSPDFMGFIFYPKSPRYVAELDEKIIGTIPSNIQKTGVFVNATFDEIMQHVNKFKLNAAQLHGDETVTLVQKLKQRGLTVIKVFRIENTLPEELGDFEGHADFFLFDTKAKAYGGTGHHFDWSALENYPYQTPYFLSGGLKLEDIERIKSLTLPGLVGIDVNSKFEIEPGLKDLNLVKQLKQQL